MCYTAAVTCIYLLIIYNSFTFFLMTVVYIMGTIHSTKISGNFGPKLNGSVQCKRKSFEKTGPPTGLLRWVSFHGQTGLNFG